MSHQNVTCSHYEITAKVACQFGVKQQSIAHLFTVSYACRLNKGTQSHYWSENDSCHGGDKIYSHAKFITHNQVVNFTRQLMMRVLKLANGSRDSIKSLCPTIINYTETIGSVSDVFDP